jgi:CheY-like chemotaxis protein
MEHPMHPAGKRGITILLVEDDPADQELTRRALEQGRLLNRLEIVDDGMDALEYLRHQGRFADEASSPRPDLVLLDLNLPRLDGREVLKAMRADPDLRRIPVVALTTSRAEEDVLATYELGVNSYISKPLDMDEFVKLLSSLQEYWFEVVMLPPHQS